MYTYLFIQADFFEIIIRLQLTKAFVLSYTHRALKRQFKIVANTVHFLLS